MKPTRLLRETGDSALETKPRIPSIPPKNGVSKQSADLRGKNQLNAAAISGIHLNFQLFSPLYS